MQTSSRTAPPPSPSRWARSLLVGAAIALAAPLAFAQVYLTKPKAVGGNPGPAHNYVCPNTDQGSAVDCFLDAVRHLYTMCKHVKSIEIIEHGIEKSGEGTNASKTEYCVDKQKQNIARPYQVALKEVSVSRTSVDNLKGLHEYWITSLAALRWQAPESDEDYHVRTGMVFPTLDELIDSVRASLDEARERAAATRGRTASAAPRDKARP